LKNKFSAGKKEKIETCFSRMTHVLHYVRMYIAKMTDMGVLKTLHAAYGVPLHALQVTAWYAPTASHQTLRRISLYQGL
jgi:hypothetical protein